MKIRAIKNYIVADNLFCIVILAVLIYTAAFGTICILRYNAFSYGDYDFAIHIQKYWNILHGKTTMPILGETTIWGNAFEISALFFSLIYALLFSSPKALLVLQSMILGLGAIPIFLIAKREIKENLALALAISYLFYPALWYVNLYEYHDMVLATLTLLLSFYFLKKDNFKYFLLFVIISLSCRADIAIVTIMFGVYALLDRKSIKWILTPIVISLLWIITSLFIFIPAFQTEVRYDVYYSHIGDNFFEIAKNMILHPFALSELLFTKRNAIFLYRILFPVGFFSIFAPKELMIPILTLVQHLVSSRYSEHTMYFHYTCTITPFIFISAIYGLARLKHSKINTNILFVYLLLLPILANLKYGPLYDIEDFVSKLRKSDLDRQREILLGNIPRNAAVISTFEFMPRLANRRYLYSFHNVYWGKLHPSSTTPYEIPENIEYAIINFNDALMIGSFTDELSDKRMKDFLDGDGWGLVETIDNIALLKKDYASNIKLYEVKIPSVIKEEFIIDLYDSIKLLDYKLSVVEMNKTKFLSFKFSWVCTEKTEYDIGIIFQIIDKQDKSVYVNTKLICYGVYPTSRWLKGELILDNYNLLLPTSIKSGEYQVKMLLLSRSNGNIISINKGDDNVVVDNQQRLLLDIIKL